MKVAVAAPSAIPARRANTVQVMKMAQALSAIGHEVRLAAPEVVPERAGGRFSWQALSSHYGLSRPFEVVWLPARPAFRRYDYGVEAVRWARAWGAEMLYTRLPQAAVLASRLGLPTVFEIHDLPQGRMGPRFLRWFMSGKGARRLVMITRALADDLAAQLGPRLGASVGPPMGVIAPDAVDLERYQDLPSPQEARRRLCPDYPGLAPERFTAGYTGHLYSGRGAELLLEIARRLPHVTFLIVGGEPQDVARTREQARGLENVLLAGFAPNSAVPAYQAACDVLLMPYQRQVAASSGGNIARYLSPMKLFEYMACERAIVSSDLPVLREVLHAENAVLLPGDSADAWVSALETLRQDEALRRSLAARARREAQEHTWEARAAAIIPHDDRSA
jgi:glycosyltransferase involved in cell wall biosynthesis